MEFKNNYGKATLRLEDNIIVASFSGNINDYIVNEFGNYLKSLLKEMPKPWGYISDSLTLLAATPEAENSLIELTTFSVKKGCIASAYILNSSIALNQMQRIINNAGVNKIVKEHVFSNVADAKAHITSQLNKCSVVY